MLSFELDPFQLEACEALQGGHGVLVCAPTGAGKTVVGEFAVHLALAEGRKCFYTTPIKALSNQKHADLTARYGAAKVGLLTGDTSVNGDAPIVVMTTEVLRNMLYAGSNALKGLGYVVMDEVHYLADRFRGAVWEEVILHLPDHVRLVSLSATVSNAEEFGEWLQALRGRVDVVIEERRPVELRHWYFASDDLMPMFVRTASGELAPNPQGIEIDRRRRRAGPNRPQRGGRRPYANRPRIPYRSDVVERLRAERMLPAIYFIFSRRGCDDAVRQCTREHLRLTTSDERAAITAYADARVADLDPAELDVLGYAEWLAGLADGIAAHHAGMIPPFKETVEELFARNLVKVVFATETLSLGINMPARSVVIESLTKFTGEKHELMTPGEYTQLAGRAGRRGIDELGHSIVLLQRFTPFDTISRLASTRTYPLRSSFTPSYNMTVNLVRSYERAEAEHLVNSSFAQFQADRAVVDLERTRDRSEAYLASYRERMRCERGDFDEYHALVARRQRVEERTRTRRERVADVVDALVALRPGDVIDVDGGHRRGRYAVLEVAQRGPERRPRVLALSQARSMVRLSAADFRRPPRALARVPLPPGFHVRDARARRRVARALESVTVRPPAEQPADDGRARSELRELARAIERHPCHACPDVGRHLHYAARAARLEKELAGIDRRIKRRTGTLAKRFERVLEILERLGYVERWTPTRKGDLLAGVYNESDLLVVEVVEDELLHGLDGPEVAAVMSALVYETRGPETGVVGTMPTAATRAAWTRLLELWRTIAAEEEVRGLELTRRPDPGFATRAYKWAAGVPLEHVLDEDDAPGDFVRSTKQLLDLLRQVEDVAPTDSLRAELRAASTGLLRGVVAYSSVEL
ncbi:MAG TPA: DEAD/DEAH box helicase [Actinomycetota bacterium]|nr:DEAD/DEAH box helicase [Actinomycetota bacterium]